MKKTFTLFIFIVSCCLSPALGQENRQSISVRDIVLSREQEQVKVAFQFTSGDKAFKNTHTLILIPVLRYGNERVLLPSIEVQGRRAAIMERRYNRLKNRSTGTPAMIIPAGSGGYYETSIPYFDWMAGADLSFDTQLIGCNAISVGSELLASDILVGDTTRMIHVTEQIARPARRTMADLQAEIYPFVAPIAEFEQARADIVEGVTFDDNMLLHLGKAVGKGKQEHVEKFVERNKPGSLMIYYTQAKSEIDPGYRGNWISVEQLIRSVRAIEESADSRVERVVIAGFASPEGILEKNDRLSWDRALAVKRVILEKTPLAEDKIRIFNGSEDWFGLRTMVAESALPERDEVIRIIDTYPREEGGTTNGRLDQLKRLHGGHTYRYLYTNYFPELRNAAYIKVYYKNVDDAE